MKAHKRAEMIKTKADNMDLVVFIKRGEGEYWSQILDDWDVSFLVGKNSYEFFLCLPQHQESCLHWLNGGDTERSLSRLESYNFTEFTPSIHEWSNKTVWMDSDYIFRIKPRKEKRWIIYNLDKDHVEQVFNRDASGFSDPSFNHSMHVIEVEV